jgi:LPXTG-motif cell wall-anchored protein
MENNKKILIVGAVALLGGLAFYFVTKKKKVTTTTLPNKPEDTANETTNNSSTDASTDVLNNAPINSTNNNSNNTSITPSKPKIVINSAFYGEGNNKIDIKKIIEDLVKLEIYQFRATNQFFGKDPSPRNVKYVFIDYTVNGIKLPLAVFNSETSSFRTDIDAVREGQLVTLFKKS